MSSELPPLAPDVLARRERLRSGLALEMQNRILSIAAEDPELQGMIRTWIDRLCSVELLTAFEEAEAAGAITPANRTERRFELIRMLCGEFQMLFRVGNTRAVAGEPRGAVPRDCTAALERHPDLNAEGMEGVRSLLRALANYAIVMGHLLHERAEIRSRQVMRETIAPVSALEGTHDQALGHPLGQGLGSLDMVDEGNEDDDAVVTPLRGDALPLEYSGEGDEEDGSADLPLEPVQHQFKPDGEFELSLDEPDETDSDYELTLDVDGDPTPQLELQPGGIDHDWDDLFGDQPLPLEHAVPGEPADVAEVPGFAPVLGPDGLPLPDDGVPYAMPVDQDDGPDENGFAKVLPIPDA